MPIYKIRNRKCCCVSGKCRLVKSCFVKCKIGKIIFFHGVVFFFNHCVSVHNSTLRNLDYSFFNL